MSHRPDGKSSNASTWVCRSCYRPHCRRGALQCAKSLVQPDEWGTETAKAIPFCASPSGWRSCFGRTACVAPTLGRRSWGIGSTIGGRRCVAVWREGYRAPRPRQGVYGERFLRGTHGRVRASWALTQMAGHALSEQRCGARTRANGRCCHHGGCSTGPKTTTGKERIAVAQRLRWQLWRCSGASRRLAQIPRPREAHPARLG